MIALNLNRVRTVCSLLVLFMGGTQASAQECEHWLSGSLHAQNLSFSGGLIKCATVWTPPAPGSAPMLVVGGSFTQIGGVQSQGVMAWDGASWRPLGNGVNGDVYGLAVYNGELVAGGLFEQASGVPAKNIAKFNGSSWSPLGTGLGLAIGLTPYCHTLTVYNNELYAAGIFWSAGGVSARNVARWDGQTWAPLGFPGSGLSMIAPSDVAFGGALQVYNGFLYIGGDFELAGGVSAKNIAKWNGTVFTALTSGISGTLNGGSVHDMTVHNGELVVVGHFNSAGGQSTGSVARWNGGSWIPQSGFPFVCSSVHSYNGQLFASWGGQTGGLQTWNGANWVAVGGGVSGGVGGPYVPEMTTYNGQLIAMGIFATAGSTPVNNIAQWNGVNWSALRVAPPMATAMEEFNGRLIIGGSFVQSTTNSVPANNLMAWDGARKTQFQGGVNAVPGFEGAVDSVRALKGYTDFLGHNHLVVGGYFTNAGGIPVNRIAMWNEPKFTIPHWSAMGAGFNGGVFTIERYLENTYAGGAFTMSGSTSTNHIAKWNGSGWDGLPFSGMNGNVYALKVYAGWLFAGGDFTFAGGAHTGGLARWNGTYWLPVDEVFDGVVYSLEVHNGKLAIGGTFNSTLGSPNFIMYDNWTLHVPHTGGTNGSILAMQSHGDDLYVGGYFTSAGGVAASNLAQMNDTNGWSAVRGGTDAVVYALGSLQNEVHVGGNFNTVEAGAVPARAWARFIENEVPWIVQQPSSLTDHCGHNVSFDVVTPAGYQVSGQWRKNGVAIINGVTPWGSTYSGTNSTHLVMSHLHAFDAGDYSCQLSNECGDTISMPATLTVETCCVEDIAPGSGDGLVNIDDLVALITSWGPCPAAPVTCVADISPFGGNAQVNIDDLVMVITAWGVCK